MHHVKVAPDLLNRLRIQARRRGLSLSQALAIYLTTGLDADPLRASSPVDASPEVDQLTDALNGRR